MVDRIYVEKKPGFDIAAWQLTGELRAVAQIKGLRRVRILNRYDVEGIDDKLFEQCVSTVFSEPQSDFAYAEMPDAHGAVVFAVEYLPGQFDQRADSASECIQFISCGKRPEVKSATLYYLEGALSAADVEAVKNYVINPIEAREASLAPVDSIHTSYPEPKPVEVIDGFCTFDDCELQTFINERELAMDLADIKVFQAYFANEEHREPTITEVKVVDTYWSDHCRHTTFGTEFAHVGIDDEIVQHAFERYLEIREELGGGEKPKCLMDIATIGAKYLKAHKILKNLDDSEEVNACTVKVKVDVDGREEDWLFLFKNETHNHPTEVEPFGGAATCIGGCIRDPLSGRSFVYQAMRLTGAADPTQPISQTKKGKLPQRKIVRTAAAGYSSYGNQIGIATGQVSELYHPGYAAKRMEIGAVVGATPADHVRRANPEPGDIIVLLGGRTGRDGIGGATGSSKAHNTESIEKCGAEVQKGNAPIERKLQRLFRRKDACRLIKRCNDFGAGGVSVACGELADGLQIDLDLIPKKYNGLDGTELAISESQERMACAIAATDVNEFLEYAVKENLEATPVAVVTDEPRVRMTWNNSTIVDISRAFLNSNGAKRHMDIHITAGDDWMPSWEGATIAERMQSVLSDLNVASNKGLSEMFDSTIGAATVEMPFGGKTQLSPSLAMVAKFPVLGQTTTTSGMAWGFNPYLSSANQFKGAYLAVVESLSRLVAAGFERKNAYFTFQEYFGSLREVPERWGRPAASLLGALMAELDLKVASIGGKDSMSGSFENLDVPPTLVSFATACGTLERATSPEFKGAGHTVLYIHPHYETDGLMPQASSLVACLDLVEKLIGSREALCVTTPGYGCNIEAIFKSCVGNQLGLRVNDGIDPEILFTPAYGSFFVELAEEKDTLAGSGECSVVNFAVTSEDYRLIVGDENIDLVAMQEVWEHGIESVFPYRGKGETFEPVSFTGAPPLVYNGVIAKPRVVIPVFPGSNCEYDSALAFRRAGAVTSTFIVNNLTPAKIAESIEKFVGEIRSSQIIMIPGGFSGGDEPDGSAKFITAFFRNPQVTDAVRDLLFNRDGLMLGICNGFQALVKLGLVPFGDIREMDATCPTLTFNTIGRHISRIVHTRIASSLSPWLSRCEVGDVHAMPVSHGEGRFVANDDLLADMLAKGQIATQYTDATGVPSMDLSVNPNGSLFAIEGITSPDGRVLGKMGHSERCSAGLYMNIPDALYQPLIEGGIGYFTD